MKDTYYKVKTSWNTYIYFDKKKFGLRHAEENYLDSDCIPVLLVDTACKNQCFLAVDAPSGELRSLVQAINQELLFIQVVADKENSTTINLVNSTGQFASAIPVDPISKSGELQINRTVAAAWENFELVALFNPSENIQGISAELNGLLEGDGLDDPHETFQFVIANPRFSAGLIPILAKRDYFDLPLDFWLETDAADKLHAAFPYDMWANQALPELRSWLNSGRKSGAFPRTIGENYDHIHVAGVDGRAPSIPAAYLAWARELVPPNQDVCIIASARNEGLYLIDWIAYHRALGVTGFFIYTNDNTDGSDLLLGKLCDHGVINLIHNSFSEGTMAQYKAYAHALQFLPETLDYEWAAVIDLDEYISIDESKYSDLSEFLSGEAFTQADSIGLSWALHGSGGESFWADEPAFLRFNSWETDRNHHIKSIFRPRRFFHSQCHYPIDSALSPRPYKSANGEPKEAGPFNDAPDYEHAWTSHLFFKSAEEFVVRRLRNRGDKPVQNQMNADMIYPDLAAMFVINAKQDLMPALQYSHGFLDKFRIEQARLRAMPGVAEAENACKAWYGREVRLMRELLSRTPRFNVPGSLEAQLLEMLTPKTLDVENS